MHFVHVSHLIENAKLCLDCTGVYGLHVRPSMTPLPSFPFSVIFNFDAFPVYVTVDGNNFASETSSVTEPCASSAFSTDQISAAQFHFSGRAEVPGRDLKTTISHKWVVG